MLKATIQFPSWQRSMSDTETLIESRDVCFFCVFGFLLLRWESIGSQKLSMFISGLRLVTHGDTASNASSCLDVVVRALPFGWCCFPSRHLVGSDAFLLFLGVVPHIRKIVSKSKVVVAIAFFLLGGCCLPSWWCCLPPPCSGGAVFLVFVFFGW